MGESEEGIEWGPVVDGKGEWQTSVGLLGPLHGWTLAFILSEMGFLLEGF